MANDFETLDRYASQALAGLLAGGFLQAGGMSHLENITAGSGVVEGLARASWIIGQAMLEARESAFERLQASRKSDSESSGVQVF